jgi:carbonic anhydrase
VEHEGHAIDIDFGRGSYIVADGVQYELQAVHFHRPSEHAVKGRLADMEAHFVHKSADGKLAVVAVLLNEDINSPNALLSSLWADLPKTEGQSSKVSESVNPAGLLPPDRGYWTYTGSLTVPPCTEGVKWIVMQQPMTVGRGQMRAFQAAVPLVSSRSLQDLHGRKIEASQ